MNFIRYARVPCLGVGVKVMDTPLKLPEFVKLKFSIKFALWEIFFEF
jgi:hypothetical protein